MYVPANGHEMWKNPQVLAGSGPADQYSESKFAEAGSGSTRR